MKQEGVALAQGKILDMGRTSLSNIGDLAMTSIVAKSENMFNLDLWRRRVKAKGK